MATTVKFTLRKNKARGDGTIPIYLRITKDRKSRFLATGIMIHPRHWNEERQRVRRSHELATASNAKLHDLLMEAERLKLDATTARDVKQKLTGTGGSLSEYPQAYIDELDEQQRYWTWKRIRVTQVKLHDCFGKALNWSDLDLVRFERAAFFRPEEVRFPIG